MRHPGIIASAQLSGGSGGGGAYQGPLDLIGSATAVVAYGPRALSEAKLGQALFTIREASGNTTQSFSSDGTTGEAPVAAIQTFLNGANGFLARWNNQGSLGSSHDLSSVTNGGYQWIASLFGGKPGFQAPTPYLDVTTFIDMVSTQNVQLPMTIFAVVNEKINTGMESTGAGSQVVFDSGDGSFDAWLAGFSTEAGIGLTSQSATGVHLFIATAGAGGQSFWIDGVLQTDLSYSYGHDSEDIPVNGTWIINKDAAAQAVEIIICTGALTGGQISAVQQNMADYYGITLP